MVFILSITILPIIISLLKAPKPKHLKHLERKMAVGLLNTLVHITVNHRRWVYVTTIAVVGLSVAGLLQIETTGNLTGDLPDGDQIKEDMTFMEDKFGGAIPFEILIDYKEPSRLAKKSTLLRIESAQNFLSEDTLFAKSLSYVDALKAANMAYYDNDSSQFRLITSRRHLSRINRYIDSSSYITDAEGVGIAINELIDTSTYVVRIRTQMKDLGSYEISDHIDELEVHLDTILNPNRKDIEKFYKGYRKGKQRYLDSLMGNYPAIANALSESYIKNDDDQLEYDTEPIVYLKSKAKDKKFKKNLRKAIDLEYFGITITGTSPVAAEGTKYMVINLFTSLLFAIIAIAILMAILFQAWRMVLVSLVPNFIPLLFTAGIMGWFGIPLKPSTLLVFSIAFGISVDDTIHYLAKYRQELKTKHWDLKECAVMAIREAGLGMFYTSIILFCGFIMFSFSQFGGTQALGILVSLTLLFAMITNLVLLPTLLLSLERRITTKSFEEPYFDAYAEESDIDWDHLDLETEIDDSKTLEDD